MNDKTMQSKKEDKAKTVKESRKNMMKTTILLTITFVILVIVFTIVKNTLLPGGAIGAEIIFLAILPFIIYLVISGKVSEFRGGGFEFKFKDESKVEVLFESEDVELLKRG